ncbi:hypothetical protein [Absidia glauca]|uniref:Uncharacterized protein n=1 Tax=Absidia glauca TaxID=4829 RepID=A0A168LX82_ABSGL|nr:hypothetical protein [Absidia glauca]
MTTIDAHTKDGESRLKHLLAQAAILVGTPQQQPEDVSLEQQLSQRLNDLQLEPSNDRSVQATFVEECVQLLVAIQEALVQEISTTANAKQTTDRDYLGVRDLRLVHTLLQVVVSWGMYPCFVPGVGVPLSKRVKSGYTNHATDEKTMARNHGTTVASIILLRHLPDLYAALLQLAYQPVSTTTPPPKQEHHTSPATLGLASNAATSQDKALGPDEKNKCARMFMWLFERSDLYRAMESLMLLLGTSPLHPVPAWLRSICGRFLSRILLKPKGVAVVLDFTSYYAVIAPQLLDLLQNIGPTLTAKDQVVTFIVGRMVSKHTALAQTYLVEPIIGGLVQAWQHTEYGDNVALTDDQVAGMLRTLHNVMIGGDPSPLVIQTFMQQCIPALYHFILMILHLIMGMADTLGPAILGKPTQILSFASSIVMEHLDRIENAQARQQRQKPQSGFPDIANIVSDEDRDAIEDAHDDSFTVEDDMESLLLAINLVRAVIHGKFKLVKPIKANSLFGKKKKENDELDRQTVQLLGSILGPLKRLEKYTGDIMQDQIHEVILAITTYLSAYNMKSSKSANDDALEQSKTKYRDAMKALQDELLPIRAHGMGMLKEMILAKDPLVSSGTQLDGILDLFVRLVQDEDSFIYLNAIKGLAALTDIHGKTIIEKLGAIYSDADEKLDNRLRVGEALLQTVQRCGDALGKYVNTLIKPLETVLSDRQTAIPLRVSALSLLSTVCQTCPVALSSVVWELTHWLEKGICMTELI